MLTRSAPALAVVVPLLWATGCATLFSDRLDDVTFETEPSGAEIYLDGRLIGRTPLTYAIARTAGSRPKIQLRLTGYETKEYALHRSLTTAAFFNTVSVQCWTTDAASGAMLEYYPRRYFVDLVPVGGTDTDGLRRRRLARRLVLVGFAELSADLARGGGPWLDALARVAAPADPDGARARLLALAPDVVAAPNALAAFDHIDAAAIDP